MQTTQARSQKASAAPKMNGRKAAVAASATRDKPEQRAPAQVELSAQEREILIARAAYLRAEQRGFVPGKEWEDWFLAEAEVLLRSAGTTR